MEKNSLKNRNGNTYIIVHNSSHDNAKITVPCGSKFAHHFHIPRRGVKILDGGTVERRNNLSLKELRPIDSRYDEPTVVRARESSSANVSQEV